MERYFGHISGTMGFGQPISLLVRIYGHARFSTLAKRIHTEKIEPYLRKKNWNLHSSRIHGFTPVENEPIKYELVAKDVGLEDKLDPEMPVKKTEINGEETYVPNYNLKAHEENHKEVMTLGLWDISKYSGPASAYFYILTESIADVLGDLGTLAHHANKEAMEDYMLRRSEFGWRLLGILSEAQHGKSHDKLRKRIKNAYTKSPYIRENPSWADIVNDVEYNGFYGACFDLIRMHGEGEGKKIVYEVIRKLQDTPDALDALLHLQSKLSIPRSIPLIKELNVTPNGLYFEHEVTADDGSFVLKIWCPNDRIPSSYAQVLIDRTEKVTEQILANLES